MRWSQLKKRIEDGFAESVRGRVEIWETRYRKAPEEELEIWVTIDAQRVASYGYFRFEGAHYPKVRQLTLERSLSQQQPDYRVELTSVEKAVLAALAEDDVLDPYRFQRSMAEFLNTSIDDCIASDDPVLRGLAVLDSRFGKRRLKALDASLDVPFVSRFYKLRCEAEGIRLETK